MIEISELITTVTHAKGHRRIQKINAEVGNARLKMIEDTKTKLSELPELLDTIQTGEKEKTILAEKIRQTSHN